MSPRLSHMCFQAELKPLGIISYEKKHLHAVCMHVPTYSPCTCTDEHQPALLARISRRRESRIPPHPSQSSPSPLCPNQEAPRRVVFVPFPPYIRVLRARRPRRAHARGSTGGRRLPMLLTTFADRRRRSGPSSSTLGCGCD